MDIRKILNIFTIIILALFFIVSIVLIFISKIPTELLTELKFNEFSVKSIIFFILLTTFISIIQIPIKHLTNKTIIIKTVGHGEKGIRGNRGSKGELGKCTTCNDSELCYKKILYNITLTYNWWRTLNGLPEYADSYIIKNEFLKSRIKNHFISKIIF